MGATFNSAGQDILAASYSTTGSAIKPKKSEALPQINLYGTPLKRPDAQFNSKLTPSSSADLERVSEFGSGPKLANKLKAVHFDGRTDFNEKAKLQSRMTGHVHNILNA